MNIKVRVELEKTILYDLGALKDCFIVNNPKDFNYHFELLKGNLVDYFNSLKGYNLKVGDKECQTIK